MSRWDDAFWGSLVADALAMPVHWYYDRKALRRDYGMVDRYMAPRNPHPDSILWRSAYSPANELGDILREQAAYWGQAGVHYHQFLEAGENTLNLRLGCELHRLVRHFGGYDADAWLGHYIACMLTSRWHHDTYVEEYHRGFFTNHASGRPPRECGIEDGHIGGLAQIPALMAALPPTDLQSRCSIAVEHVRLTHRHDAVMRAAETLVRILHAIAGGAHPRDAIEREGEGWFHVHQASAWTKLTDDTVVGEELSPACYIGDAFPAALYLAWKYAEDFSAGIEANAMVGGDNCHRGAIIGALLGASNGVPGRWMAGLKARDYLGDGA
ncbi:MAG: ADP-ribosylglycohydrolase family protein [Verrucomicrobiae bacterium]|nr:ADP-ribosylglycohydrolase family protein [Verrucomicrobiae bacterium]